jgi:hypothetical protein
MRIFLSSRRESYKSYELQYEVTKSSKARLYSNLRFYGPHDDSWKLIIRCTDFGLISGSS